MSEIEKQEGQKTVVAFIAGLLIGGLLVWVFSAPTENINTDVVSNTEEAELTTDTADTSDTDINTNGDNIKTTSIEVIEDGVITVDNQTSGAVVVLGDMTFPTNNGWVVVRDYIDGVSGKILGAARYSQDVGLLPESINLLRDTKTGDTYVVMFYNENGDRVFDLEDDVEIEGFSSTFTAN